MRISGGTQVILKDLGGSKDIVKIFGGTTVSITVSLELGLL